MNDTFDPGPGWRPLADDEILDEHAESLTWGNAYSRLAWTREAPVPPLPTAPYTVIRVPSGQEWWRDLRGNWRDLVNGELVSFLGVTSFEVLSEPRAVTAKAALDRAAMSLEANGAIPDFRDVAREFGVE